LAVKKSEYTFIAVKGDQFIV